VEGRALARVLANQPDNALDIPQHFSRRNSQRQNPIHRKPGITSLVSGRAGPSLMRLAVNLDAQLGCITVEVERVNPRRMLVSPVMAEATPSQAVPQDDLRECHFPALCLGLSPRLTRSLKHGPRPFPRFARPSTMLRMVPLPQQSWGRI